MFTRLERYAYASIAALVLWAVLLMAAWPVVADAQETSRANDPQGSDRDARAAGYVVVASGDSLWSISERQLGPNASPRRVMNLAGRIHALNRARIGADPDLVLVGQELSIPRAVSEPPTAEATPARKAARAAETGPRDRAATESAGEEAPREAPRQGAIPRSGISLEEAAEMLGADTKGEGALPDQRAVAPVPAARMVASNDAQPSSVGPLLRTVRTGFASAASALTDSLFGAPADARAEGRRLLGLGIVALTTVGAALLAACARGIARREARRREAWFRERYGSPYAALDPSASQEEASRRVPEVCGRTASSESPVNTGAASEDRSDHLDPSAVARAKRARVLQKRPLGLRRQPLRLRARGSRRPVRARAVALGRPLDGLPSDRARREEWEPSAAFVGALEGLPLRPGAGLGENLARLRPLLGEAFGELGGLERRRGLSEGEATRRKALRALMAATERAE